VVDVVRRLLRLASTRPMRWAFVVVAVALAAWAVAARWHAVVAALHRLDVRWLLAALVVTVLNLGLVGMAWRALLSDLGSRLSLPVTARVFFVGQVGKYLPGSLWPMVVQAELARDHGVPRRRTAAATMVLLLLSAASGLVVVLAALPFVPSVAENGYRWTLLLLVPMVALLHPRLLGPLLDRLIGAIGGEPLERRPTAGGTALAFAWAVASWLVAGLQVWLLSVSLGAEKGWHTLALAIAGYALAWAVGLVVVIAPAGAGAREVALAAVLAPMLDGGAVVVVVLLSRVLFTVADLVAAAAGYGLGRRHVSTAGPTATES
jgi:glycosyltransferase 2 family protein